MPRTLRTFSVDVWDVGIVCALSQLSNVSRASVRIDSNGNVVISTYVYQ